MRLGRGSRCSNLARWTVFPSATGADRAGLLKGIAVAAVPRGVGVPTGRVAAETGQAGRVAPTVLVGSPRASLA